MRKPEQRDWTHYINNTILDEEKRANKEYGDYESARFFEEHSAFIYAKATCPFFPVDAQ